MVIGSSGTITGGTIAVEFSADGVKWTVSGTPVQDGSNVLRGTEVLAHDYPLVRVKCTENIAGSGTPLVSASVCGRSAHVPV